MKIAFLNFYSGHLNRGGETFVRELAERLAQGHQISVFQGGPKSGSEKYQAVTVNIPMPKVWPPGLSVKHFLKRLFLDYYKLKELVFTLKALPSLMKFKPDIVSPVNGGWQALIISLYCRLFGAKLVIVGHSGPGWDDRWNLLVKPDLFVALTKHQLDWARKAIIWKQEFVLIPNGIDLDQFTQAGKKMKLDLEKPIIIIAAASTLAKRVERGIRAVAQLKSGSLLLLGSGPLDKRINKLGYELLGKKRFFHTTANYELMPEYYRAADILTLCSDSSEAFGIVYLEAMATGLACVGTDDKSRREIIGAAGVFVKDPNDVAEYTKALETALKINWKDLPKKQAEKYSWETIAKKYENAFASLLKK